MFMAEISEGEVFLSSLVVGSTTMRGIFESKRRGRLEFVTGPADRIGRGKSNRRR